MKAGIGKPENRTRRSQKKKKEMSCSILYSNVNGFKGKSVSIQEILKKLDSELVVLCEVKLANVNKVKEVMPQYQIIDRCIKQGKGGIVVAQKRNTVGSFVNVTSTENKNILVTRLAMGSRYIRIIVGYAPQESDLQEIREAFFEELSVEIVRCRMCSDSFILLGDLNSKISKGTDGNIVAESANGALLAKIIDEQSLVVVNFSEKCSGKWTHVIRTTSEMSCLDYVITSGEVFQQNVQDMMIDETCLICPFSLKISLVGRSLHSKTKTYHSYYTQKYHT